MNKKWEDEFFKPENFEALNYWPSHKTEPEPTFQVKAALIANKKVESLLAKVQKLTDQCVLEIDCARDAEAKLEIAREVIGMVRRRGMLLPQEEKHYSQIEDTERIEK